ncbi:MAG: SPOR domain-containing protein [Bacteroidota bacterium]|jgi:hypothetical protein|nr:MAG: hypothetical protein DIU61_12015 [Bacteroidota bacterium]
MAKDNRPDEPEDSSGNFDESDDTFGLPEIEYEPIKREQEPTPEPPSREWEEERKEVVEPVAEESSTVHEEHTYEPPRYEEPPRAQYAYTYSHETSSPVWPKVLGILLLLAVLIGGGLWYFLKYKPERDEEARLAAARQAAADEQFRRERARADSLAEIERARVRRINDSLARIPPKPASGTIDTLTGRTGRYYVIVASNIDDDLLMDYARKLSAAGVSSKLIPPHGNVKFYRLAIAEGDTYASAQATADGMKADYGDGLWVTKY